MENVNFSYFLFVFFKLEVCIIEYLTKSFVIPKNNTPESNHILYSNYYITGMFLYLVYVVCILPYLPFIIFYRNILPYLTRP